MTKNFTTKDELVKSFSLKRETPVTGRQASQKRLSPAASCKEFEGEKSDYKMFSQSLQRRNRFN